MKINIKVIQKNLLDIENNFKKLNDKFYLKVIEKAALMIIKSMQKICIVLFLLIKGVYVI